MQKLKDSLTNGSHYISGLEIRMKVDGQDAYLVLNPLIGETSKTVITSHGQPWQLDMTVKTAGRNAQVAISLKKVTVLSIPSLLKKGSDMELSKS